MRSQIERIALLTVLATTLVGCTLRTKHNGPYYTPVATNVTYLSEDLAISIAKETMAKEGYDLAVWQVRKSDERRKPDQVVKRISVDPRQVRVLFSDGKKYREVQVVLQDGRVSSSLFFGM